MNENDVSAFFCGYYYASFRKPYKPTQVRHALLFPFIDTIKYWSAEAIRLLLTGVEEMMTELGVQRARPSFFERLTEKDELLSSYYDQILSGEDMPLLPGLSLCETEKTEDGKVRIIRRIFIDPERHSCKIVE